MLASHFGVRWAGYEGEDQRFKLEEAMVGKEPVWAAIVKENGLVETELEDVHHHLVARGCRDQC